jgi:hypothetical protein
MYSLAAADDGWETTIGVPLSLVSTMFASIGKLASSSRPNLLHVCSTPSLPKILVDSRHLGHVKKLMFCTIPRI